MGTKFVENTTLITENCCICGVIFAMPKELNDSKLCGCETESFWCPNGHKQHYTGKSDGQKLEEKDHKISKLVASNAQLNECCINYQDQAKKNDYRARNYKGRLTKLMGDKTS